jgi:hypothetical protein
MPEEDVPVAREMAAYLGGRHALLPEEGHRNSEEFHQISRLGERNIGHFSERADIAAYMYQAYERRRDLVFVRGYGGEIIQGFYGVGGKPGIEALAAADLVRAYGLSMKKPFSDKFVGLVSEAVEQFMARANYEGLDGFGYDINDLYYWESRMGMWGGSMHNVMDAAMLSFPGFNSRRLFEAAFGLEPEERQTYELLLGLTRRYDEELAKFPVNPSKKPKKARQNDGGSPTQKQLRERLEAQRERNKVLTQRLRARESELKEIKQSRSWRYTRLIRNFLSAARSRISRRPRS